jgi:cell wall-associated NlpC family hydrolase
MHMPVMSKAGFVGLPPRFPLAAIALVFLALTACSFTPMRADPDGDASAAPAPTGQDAEAGDVPAQADPDGDGRAEAPQAEPDVGGDAARYALEMVGIPYRYGGKTPKGLDCSGLVLYSYALAGKRLPVNLERQRAASRPVPRKQMRPGDLLFFELADEGRSHVGLYIGSGKFVHAPSRGKLVSTASLSNPYWRRHFSGARRPALDQRQAQREAQREARRAASATSSRPERPVRRPEGI